MQRLRTGLYVPGDRPDRFPKAVGSGADLVVFDLEDAVVPEAKGEARSLVGEWLTRDAAPPGLVLQVRVNPGEFADLEMIAALPTRVGVRVPKVEQPEDLEQIAAAVPGRPIVALLESPAAVMTAESIAAHPACSAIALGEADLRSRMAGGEPMIDFARLRLAYAAAARGLPAPMLSVYPQIDDPTGLAADTARGAACGFWGRMAVHPVQLPTIVASFQPSEEEIVWATEALKGAEEGGARRLASGEMVDPAMTERARRILRDAGGSRVTQFHLNEGDQAANDQTGDH